MKNYITNLWGTASKLAVSLITLTLISLACSSTDEPSDRTANTLTVETEQAQLESFPTSLSFSGRVASKQRVQMSTKIMGRISHLNVEEGEEFRKGELLLRIRDDNLIAQRAQIEGQLQQARAEFVNTEKNYNRLRELARNESTTQKELDDITARYESSRAHIKTLEGKISEIEDLLDYSILKAPFEGYVVKKNASEGDLTGPGQPLLILEKKNALKVVGSVPESRISLFEAGDTVLVHIRAAFQEEIEGIVSTVNPAGNAKSHQFQIEITLYDLKPEYGLKSGMYAEIRRTSATKPSLVISRSALLKRGQLNGIYTLNEQSELVLRWIRLGEQYGNRVHVLSGLSPGETYVSSIDGSFREGLKVNAR